VIGKLGRYVRWIVWFSVVTVCLFPFCDLGATQEGQAIEVKTTGCDWSKSSEDYLASAENYQTKALYFLAIESYSCAIQIDPQRMQPYSSRAWALMMTGQFDRASDDIHRVLKAEPHNSAPHILLYTMYFEQGKYSDALVEIDKTLELNALESNSYLVRGQIYVKLNDEAKALEAFNQYFYLQKFSIFEAQAYAEIGFAYEHFGDAEAAARYLRQAVALHGDVGTLYLGAGQADRMRADFPAALENLNRAIRLNTPELIAAYTERAAVYMGLKNDGKALGDCEQIIQLQPQKPQGYTCKGVVLIDLGKANLAVDSFNEAIRLDKSFVSAYGGRAAAEIAMGNYDLALADLNFAIQAEPLVSTHYQLRAHVYTVFKNPSAAIDDYEIYMRLRGGARANPEIVDDIRRLRALVANV